MIIFWECLKLSISSIIVSSSVARGREANGVCSCRSDQLGSGRTGMRFRTGGGMVILELSRALETRKEPEDDGPKEL